ncbi:hypothetical protein AB0C27_52665 [Nonomuraea sp. NPDC048882]|uniref:alpha/beta hydrolase n=1 Tax=Nonomuraea sp. NPDC048882 TaxID=3154347 RepID=UPI0033E4D724
MLLVPRPAADTPWLTVSEDGYASFTVPMAAVEAAVGPVSQVVIEGNIGPSSTWAEFGLTRRGDAWSGVLGPLKPGLYSYRVTGEPYPVLFLQPGDGVSATDWLDLGRARQILDHHFLDGNLVPISSDPSRQALAGLSMGDGQTFGMLKANPGRFAYVAAFSAGFGSGAGVDTQAINDGTRLLRLYVGDRTDFVYPSFMASLDTLNTLGIRYEFDGVTPGPHGWDEWQKNLIDLAPRLFKR